MRDKIRSLLADLKLRGIATQLDGVLNEAEKNGTAISDVLLELLEAEHRDQQERSLASRVKRAKIPWPWTIDTFPFNQQPTINKAQIMGLAKLNFIERNENIILIGEAGTGKSGIATALLRLAVFNGYRGRFYNAQDMLNDIYASFADRTTSKVLKNLSTYDLLIIDELGFLSLNPEQVNMFFKLIDMRYQKKSTIITTNLKFEDWYEVFNKKQLVDAMLDRFRHYCTTIYIEGPSLRVPQSSTEAPSKQKSMKKGAAKDQGVTEALVNTVRE